MQSLTWYFHRLQSMSTQELAWRARSALRDVADRYRFAQGRFPSVREALPHREETVLSPGFPVSDVEVGVWASLNGESPESDWCDRLVSQADRIVEHRLSFFNLTDHPMGDPIDWNRDWGSGKKAPMAFAPSIDYRDFEVTGDCKFVWEPNRHHQLVVLGRAYRATGDLKYAREIVGQLDSWLLQNPFGQGMNWRSPLELAIRLINWVWAVDLALDSGLFDAAFRERVLHAVYLHLWEITRKYSRGSSANNHVIGEAAGVFVATSYFPHFPNAASWRREAMEILAEEIVEQTYPDGGNREQAFGYHLFVLQFTLVAGFVARRTEVDFPGAFWNRLEKMVDFAEAITQGGGGLPFYGDCDDGYVLDLGTSPSEPRGLLAAGAGLCGRPDWLATAGGCTEPAFWLFGPSLPGGDAGADEGTVKAALESKAFADGGHYLLQYGTPGSEEGVSLLFDCGELGYRSIAAHGHADALSFTLRAFGEEVFVDPGTYDYFTFPAWRDYFRSTRAHNTAAVDAEDQSVKLGSFLWGERARARCLRWEPGEHGGTVTGEHDGYARLSDPVIHRRTLELDGQSGILTITDRFVAEGAHEVSLYFHLAEHCVLSAMDGPAMEIRGGKGTITLDLDPALEIVRFRGSEDPIFGWVSRGYHRKAPSHTIVAGGAIRGETTFVCRIRIGSPRRD